MNNYISPKICFGRILCFRCGRCLRRRTPIKACVLRYWDTNAHIKFIFDAAIDDQEWKNPIHFGENRIIKVADGSHNFIRKAPIKLIFAVTIELPGKKNWGTKMAASDHFEKII